MVERWLMDGERLNEVKLAEPFRDTGPTSYDTCQYFQEMSVGFRTQII